MIKLSTLMGGGGSSQLGDSQLFPESGTLITKPNGEVWLHGGVVALTSSYPQCAGIEHLMAHGAAGITLPVNISVTGFAHNGAGVGIVTYGGDREVLATTNYGQSWVKLSVAFANQCIISDVCWHINKFVLVGVDNANYTTRVFSSDGAALTLVAGSSNGGNVSIASGRIASDGTTAIIVVDDNANSLTRVGRSADGSAFTWAYLPSYCPSPSIAVLPSAGVNRWLVSACSGFWLNRSTAANGSSWESHSAPSIAGFACLSAGNGMFVGSSYTGIFTSPTGVSGSWTALNNVYGYSGNTISTPGFGSSNLAEIIPLAIQFDGTRFLFAHDPSTAGGPPAQQFSFTTDLVKFNSRQIAQPIMADGASSCRIVPLSFGANMAFVNSGTPSNKATYSLNWLTSSEYVGTASRSTIISTGGKGSRPLALYTRIK